MSNQIMNAHIEYGSPMGDDSGIVEVADHMGDVLLEIKKLIPSLITVMRMPNAEHEADAHNRAVSRLREIANLP